MTVVKLELGINISLVGWQKRGVTKLINGCGLYATIRSRKQALSNSHLT